MRTLRWFFIGCGLGALGALAPAIPAGAQEKPTAGACSLRYGYLMTDHWLAVDLAQQIERGLFYRHGDEAMEDRKSVV